MANKKRISHKYVDVASATLKDVRISPRKLGLVADMVRGKPVSEAASILKFTPKKGANIVSKVLFSAIANVKEKFGNSVDIDNLSVTRCWVGSGPRLKRFLPRAKGMATPILKKFAHLTVAVGEKGKA